MKKPGFLFVFAVLTAAVVFAQTWGNWGGASQPITVSGTLQLQNGEIAVASGTTVYFVPALGRYIGFIEELKAGSAVSIEGYVYGNLLQPTQLTINGKSYEFLANAYSPGFGCGAYCMSYGGGFGGMRGGYGSGRGRMGSGPGRRW